MSIKRRLELSMPPKSNMSTYEQRKWILRTIASSPMTLKSISLSNENYLGVESDLGGFYIPWPKAVLNHEEVKREAVVLKAKPVLLFMHSMVSALPINRYFSFSFLGNELEVKDTLQEESIKVPAIYSQDSAFTVNVDSSILYLFRLSPKTISSKTSLHFSADKGYIDLKRLNFPAFGSFYLI